MRIVSVYKGGDGSGHKGHKGRVGKRGGSLPGTSSPSTVVRIEDMPLPGTAGYQAICKVFGVSNITKFELQRRVEAMYNYDMKTVEMHSTVTHIQFSEEGDVIVSGDIYGVPTWGTSKERVSVGKFNRTLVVDENDERVVSHDSLTISPGWRKKGFGSSFFQFGEDEYIKQGFDTIVVFAGDDVGGYAWARLGFDFNANFVSSGGMPHDYVKSVREAFKYHWERRYNNTPAPDVSVAHPWEIAILTGPDGFDIGRMTLTGSQWPGVKSLKAGSVGLDIGDAYYYAKRKALRDESKS